MLACYPLTHSHTGPSDTPAHRTTATAAGPTYKICENKKPNLDPPQAVIQSGFGKTNLCEISNLTGTTTDEARLRVIISVSGTISCDERTKFGIPRDTAFCT